MWLDGTPYWNGVQMDETGLPDPAGGPGASQGRARRDRAGAPLADGPAGRGVPGAQRPGHPAGPLGGGPRLLALHARGRGGGAAVRRRPRRHPTSPRSPRTCARPPTPGTAASSAGPTSSATDLAARQVGVDGYYVRIAPPEEADAASPVVRLRPDQEPPARPEPRARRAHRQPRRARAGPLRPARRRRPADREHGRRSSTRSSRSTLRRARPGAATTATATASTRTGSRSTAPASGAPGRSSPGSARTTSSPRAGRLERRHVEGALSRFASEGGLLPEQVWDARRPPRA